MAQMKQKITADLIRFYNLMDSLEKRVGGKRTLALCDGRMQWPARGVYFFFEDGQLRSNSGTGLRVVRVGTHGLKEGSKSSLWMRLSQHMGSRSTGSGHHRGSIFRLIVGDAILRRDGLTVPTWGVGSSVRAASKRFGMTVEEVKLKEGSIETLVSDCIRSMPFLWISIDDPPGPDSLRGLVERNSIALLSNWGRPALDPPSPDWLGATSSRPKVRHSGLWNNNHVDETYDSNFLNVFESLVAKTQEV